MNEQTLKEMIDKPNKQRPEIIVKKKPEENKKFIVLVDGKTLQAQRKHERLFRIQTATEYLEDLGITEFRVEL